MIKLKNIVNENYQTLMEGFDLPPNVDKMTDILSGLIGSFYLLAIKNTIDGKYFNGKKMTPERKIELQHDYILAQRQRNSGLREFDVQPDSTDTYYGKSNYLITAKNMILPAVYLVLVHANETSRGAVFNYDNNTIQIKIDMEHFVDDYILCVEELNESLKHEMRHYFQFSDLISKKLYRGMAKPKVINKNYDIFGRGNDGISQPKYLPHHLHDIEFKTNVHTYAYYIKKWLNTHYKKSDWQQPFHAIITGRLFRTRNSALNQVGDNMGHMFNKDRNKWRQFTKEVYKEIFEL